jgi:hypothetical protein
MCTLVYFTVVVFWKPCTFVFTASQDGNDGELFTFDYIPVTVGLCPVRVKHAPATLLPKTEKCTWESWGVQSAPGPTPSLLVVTAALHTALATHTLWNLHFWIPEPQSDSRRRKSESLIPQIIFHVNFLHWCPLHSGIHQSISTWPSTAFLQCYIISKSKVICLVERLASATLCC